MSHELHHIFLDLLVLITSCKPDGLSQIALGKIHTEVSLLLVQLQLIHEIIKYIMFSDRLHIQHYTSGLYSLKHLIKIIGEQYDYCIGRSFLDRL